MNYFVNEFLIIIFTQVFVDEALKNLRKIFIIIEFSKKLLKFVEKYLCNYVSNTKKTLMEGNTLLIIYYAKFFE